MKRTLLLLAGLALSTTACGRMADQALLLIQDDDTTVEVKEGSVTIESDQASLGDAKFRSVGAPGTRVNAEGAKVVVNNDDSEVRVGKDGSKVNVDPNDSEVRVNKDGTKVRTGGGKVDVKKNDGDSVKGDSVKVHNDSNGTRVEVGGVKVDGTNVTVPGVATVYGY